MRFDVFISYATKDKLAADAACAALEAAHIRCWIAPRDILPGADWSASIIDALDECRAVVLIFSASANESTQIRNEVVHAVQRGVPVVPVRLEDIPPAKSLAYFMGSVHWLDAMSPPLESHLRRLADSVKALLHVDDAPPGDASAVAAAVSAPAPPQPAARSRALLLVAALAVVGAAGAVVYALKPDLLAPRASDVVAPPVAKAPVAAPRTALTDLMTTRLAALVPDLSLATRHRIVREYIDGRAPKAQAISLAPQGTWRATGRDSIALAEESALENCQSNFGQPCVLIAINDDVLPVPEGGNWPRRDMPRVRYAGNFDPNQIPGVAHLRRRADIAGYAAATGPKAVAYHPTSQVFVVTGAPTQRAAEEQVLDICNKDTGRPNGLGPCFLYAVGNQVVLPQRLRKPMS